MIWKVDGYIRSFDFAALQYGDFGNVKKEVTAYVSEDGQTWRELNVSATTPVPDPNYAPGVAVAWLDSTVSPKIDVGGEFQYLKIVIKTFDSGVKWLSLIHIYIVEVTAVESFGLESDPISADFTTLPVTTPSPSINRADMLLSLIHIYHSVSYLYPLIIRIVSYLARRANP